MAIFHLTVKTGSRLGGQSARAKADYIERSREQWFKRYNSKEPENGGARKSMATRPKDWLEETRKAWADHANQALERVGSRERIHEGTLERQYRDALEAGDDREAARLEYREPGVHIGPHNVARAERGVVLERISTAQAVEVGNQEIKRDREEITNLEGLLWHARAMVVQVAKQIVAKVRERFERERERGRDGPDHGWSR